MDLGTDPFWPGAVEPVLLEWRRFRDKLRRQLPPLTGEDELLLFWLLRLSGLVEPSERMLERYGGSHRRSSIPSKDEEKVEGRPGSHGAQETIAGPEIPGAGADEETKDDPNAHTQRLPRVSEEFRGSGDLRHAMGLCACGKEGRPAVTPGGFLCDDCRDQARGRAE